MKWSFILILPALVSLFWALATLLLKRRPTRAQIVLSLTMILMAFAIVVLDVFFRGRAGKLFIYDFVFETAAVLCAPFYYMGICALTEPRGATLRQRRSFVLPLLFIVALIAGSFWLGPRRYEELCYALRDTGASFIPGDTPWNFMLFWTHWFFPAFLLIMSFILVLFGTRKVQLYQRRFNSYYADDMQLPYFNTRNLVVFAWIFLPLGALSIFIIIFRPYYYKYWLILCASLLSVLQFIVGLFTYRLNHDARFLAEYIRNKNQ